MKALSKLVSALLMVALVLAAFPAIGASTAKASTCDWARFVADVTIPDGTTFAPGATFQKIWRLRNIGTCAWTSSYALVFDSGEHMGAPTEVSFPQNSYVAPGQTIDLPVNMTAPSSAGHYFGYWKLRNASGTKFGIGWTANLTFWVEINVGTPSGSSYDFTAHAAEAAWSSGAGALPFPGTNGDAKGFGLKLDKPKFESAVEQSTPGLLMSPQNIYNGYIQAKYPAIRVQTGDRFQATVGCEFGATNCYVAYRLDYQIGNGPIRTYWTFREKYEGWTYFVNLNLNPLAGQDVNFILFISAYGNATGDRALWGNPVITGLGGPGPGVTPIPPSTSCDRVQFIKDVTVPDGTTFTPGTTFNKTWRLKNVGNCTWTSSYQLVFFSGEQMGGPSALTFPQSVAPGQEVDLTVSLTAPNTAYVLYRGYWMFKNPSGVLFGIGAQANRPWWVEIYVSPSTGPTFTPAVTSTLTATPTATFTPTETFTPTATFTPTVTFTPTTPAP